MSLPKITHTNTANESLFSYGTLQNEEMQVKLFKRTLSGTPDILKGYKVVILEIKDEAFLANGEDKFQRTLVPTNNENDFIRGTALELTPEELLKADSYEPANYKRIKVTLASGIEAWLYVADEIK